MKPKEIAPKGALPSPGKASTEAPPEALGSTLSEPNTSKKTGGPAQAGASPLTGDLTRVRVDAGTNPLTTNQGVAVGDNQNSLKAGPRGPALLEDFILREKITHFDHERIPERIVHARGSGAHGYFENYRPQSKLTRASLFAEAGKRTPVFVRFSTVAGERGSKDTARDVRGFAVKFYTDEGNWDLVGNNIPIFFIQDAMKFPDLVHAVKPESHHAMPQAASAHDTFWDFVSLMPESTAMLLWLMSDRAIPRSYRMMQGFGVHTFQFVNDRNEARFVKFHWNPNAGTHSLAWDEAVKIAGADPDFHRRDLWEAIEAGTYPEWELGVQVFTQEQADHFSFDVLDATKIIPEEIVPVTPLGRLVLNRNPDNFFAETEQVAFCTAHIVPGIDFTNDPLLAGRIHSYVDTQVTRLGGPNFHEIPINAPVAPVHNNQRDGMHRQAISRGRVSYEPNSLAAGCPFQAGMQGFVSVQQRLERDSTKVRAKPEKFADHYTQATLFWNSQSSIEKQHIVKGFRFELTKVQVPAIRKRMVSSLLNVAKELAQAVAEGLGIELPEPMPRVLAKPSRPEVTQSPALSLLARPGQVGIASRRVAVILGGAAQPKTIARVRAFLRSHGAVPTVLGVSLAVSEGSRAVLADSTLEASPSVIFDAVVVCGEAGNAPAPGKGLIMEFLRDQYRHCKPILAIAAAGRYLREGNMPEVLPSSGADPGVILCDEAEIDDGLARFAQALSAHRIFDREADPPPI
ncbi:MAG TPA: catalase [Steroidobacteraceae bacterium]